MSKDLISSSKLRNDFDEKCYGECCYCTERDNESGECGLVQYAPTVDAVEVVRCKDCKHRGFAGECPMCYTDAYDEDYGYDYWDVDKTVDEGFCHCGEKWDAEVE